jgi:hypothetical protein
MMGDTLNAILYYQKTLGINPKYPRASENLHYLKMGSEN